MNRFWNSLRWRIVTYYTLLLAVAVGSLVALHQLAELRRLEQLTAARLQADGLGLLPAMFSPRLGRPGEVSRSAMLREGTDFQERLAKLTRQGVFVLAEQADRVKVFAATNLPPGFRPPSADLSGESFHCVEHDGFFLAELRTPPGDRLILGLSSAQLRADARQTLLMSSLLGAGIFTGLVVVGALLVFRGLRPIADMSAAARRIAAGNLTERLAPETQGEELRGLAGVLNETFDRLHGVLQRQIRFTADASHELRTPVAAILADCQFSLKKERSPERYRETITVCHESAQHMRSLIDRLSLLARFDAEDSVLQPESLDVREVAETAVAVVAPLAQEQGVIIQNDLCSVATRADRLRLDQVVVNLLRNAILYNRPGGRVTLRNGETNGVAWIEVADTGIGIPTDKLERVFERFFRADESRNAHTGGLGLGLAICRAIMHAHGGTISVRSESGQGSTFRVEWPVVEKI
jgi:two-component system OmpR family sensor kinase